MSGGTGTIRDAVSDEEQQQKECWEIVACGDVETDGLKMFIKIQRTGVVERKKRRRSDQVGEHHHTFHEGRHTPYLPTCRALQHYGVLQHYSTTGYYSTTFLRSSRVLQKTSRTAVGFRTTFNYSL